MPQPDLDPSKPLSSFLTLTDALFGVRWERALALCFYATASLSFYAGVIDVQTHNAPRPLDAFARLMTAVNISEPGWLETAVTWSADQHILGVLSAAAAGATATVYSRAFKTGPEIATVLLAMAAVQLGGPWMLVVVVLASVLPMLIALAIARLERWGQGPRTPTNYRKSGVLQQGRFANWPMTVPVILPAAIVVQLVRCYRHESHSRPAGDEVAHRAASELLNGSHADRRAALQVLILSSTLTTDPDSRDELITQFLDELEGPTGAIATPHNANALTGSRGLDG